jgi:iron complex outermembrane recepter protein
MNSTSKYRGRCSGLLKLGASAIALTMVMGVGATAQEENLETVTVTGYRASLEGALNIKRASNQMVDAINAEDIAAFPDANLAESLQRLPGVSIDRDNGEGRTITVRGLNADFTRVTLNGMEALSTAGASAAGDDPNRSRQFDFNTFASELFSGLKVYKSPAAETDEGSLGATVELQTGRPFDIGNKFVVSLQNGSYEYGKGLNPRIAALASQTFLGGRLGITTSIAYNMRDQALDSYKNSVDVSNLLFRSMTYKTSASTVRYGFADTYSSSDTSHCASSATSTVPLTSVSYYPYCQALQGSNADYSSLVGGTTGSSGLASTVIMPTLATLNHQVLYQSRIGGTASVQFQADDNTLITFDGVFSSTYQNSTNYQVTTTGLNRNYTSSNMNKLIANASKVTINNTTYAAGTSLMNGVSTSNVTKNKTYLQSAFSDAGDKCTNVTAATAALYGVAAVTCLTSDDYSATNYAYNVDPYNYYTSSGTNLDAGAAAVISFVGRPTAKLVSAHVITPTANSATALMMANGNGTVGVMDQMTVANLDLSSRADEANYTTQFMQGSLNVDHNFSERLHVNVSLGMSVSRNHQEGYVVEFNRMDSGTYSGSGTTCTGCYVYDATGGGNMPYIDYGFDVSSPNSWSLVKGYSNLKHYITNTVNKFRSLKVAVSYDISEMFTVKAGFNGRIYDFDTVKYARVMKDGYGMPSLSELQGKYGSNFSISDLGKTVGWGTGLDTPAGMSVTNMFVPDLNKFKKYIFSDTADFGDIMGVSSKFSAASTSVTGNTYDVHEHDKSGYAQVDFKEIEILNRELRGNIGVRVSTTSVDSYGHGTVGNAIADKRYYANVLPSANVNYSLTDNMVLRASIAKVIARPQLATMSPSITSFSIDSTMSGGSSMVIGNTKLKPYSANTIDVGYEWYFDEGAVLAVTGFTKFIKDVPQQVTTSGYLDEYMDSESFQQVLNVYTSVPGMISTTYPTALSCSYNETNAGCKFTVTTYKNARGGVLNGIEFNYQQVLKFLPAPFDTLGINANYTMIHSLMHYIISPATKAGGTDVTGDGPWTGASPNAYNITVFYDGKDWANRDWSGRVSFAYRSKYVYKYPLKSGSTNPGSLVSDSSPIMNDFEYTQSTLNVDTSFTYDYTPDLQLRIDALNLTNETSNRFAFQGAPMITNYAASGRQIFAGVRFKY